MLQTNSELVYAFPSHCRNEVASLAGALPKPDLTAHSFSALVDGEEVRIPYRIYLDVSQIDRAPLNMTQIEILDCLLTRHHDGYVREEYLKKILGRNQSWIPPFVIRLLGEYVIEILNLIRDGLDLIDHDLYRTFLLANPEFFQITKQRVFSYRACYYATFKRNNYVGFEIVNFLDGLVKSK